VKVGETSYCEILPPVVVEILQPKNGSSDWETFSIG
jgi:hypothetical protein